MLAVVGALVLTSCGVPVDGAAHVIPTTPIAAPQPAPVGSAGTRATLQLFFLFGTRLVEVNRRDFAYPTVQATANELLLDLDNGPLLSEGSGLTTLLNSNPGMNCTFDPSTHLVTVSLDGQFVDSLFGQSLYEAYGQIVLTLMDNKLLSAIHGVLFTYEQQPWFAYLPSATTTAEPVTAAPYEQLVQSTPVHAT